VRRLGILNLPKYLTLNTRNAIIHLHCRTLRRLTMKDIFPYCDQHDCKHYETCQSESNIVIRLLQQTTESIKLHNVCRDIMQSMWDNHIREVLQRTKK